MQRELSSSMFMIIFIISTYFIYANEQLDRINPLIEKYDKDGDGKIFYTEAPKALQEKFCQYDVNQDGFIDALEVVAIKEVF